MIETISLWHKRARPTPADADFNVQLGCHYEEIAEMFDALDAGGDMDFAVVKSAIKSLADRTKAGHVQHSITNRVEMLDSLGDQVVTAAGVSHCAGMDMDKALRAINHSNWSKFDKDGLPIRNEQGKIIKGPNYMPPVLKDYV